MLPQHYLSRADFTDIKPQSVRDSWTLKTFLQSAENKLQISVPACSLSLWKLPTSAVILAFSYSVCQGVVHSITNGQLFRKPTGLSKLVRLTCVSATCNDNSNYSSVIIHLSITVQPIPLSFRTHLRHPTCPSNRQKPSRPEATN